MPTPDEQHAALLAMLPTCWAVSPQRLECRDGWTSVEIGGAVAMVAVHDQLREVGAVLLVADQQWRAWFPIAPDLFAGKVQELAQAIADRAKPGAVVAN